MKTIRNRTHRPLRVPLPGGRALHLGPSQTGQVQDHAVEHPALLRLVESGEIEIVGEGHRPAGAGTGSASHPRSQGHPHGGRVPPKGDR